jgi:sugar phosphate isomerase/epimerase
MLTRRTFVHAVAAATASALAAPTLAALAPWPSSPLHTLKDLGFIANIVGNELQNDWKGTLQKAVDWGFTEIETARHYGHSPSVFRAYCRQIGIRPIGGGITMQLEGDALQERLGQLQAIGATHAVVYWPWFVSAPFKLTDCQRSAERLNQLGQACKKQGLTFCWHNHDREFVPMETGLPETGLPETGLPETGLPETGLPETGLPETGLPETGLPETGLPFDYLMANTDPDLVKCEMDVYWVSKGGGDPVTVLQKYPGRYRILHLKDMSATAEQTFECPGSGIIDFGPVLAEARRQGIRHYIVERDKIVDGLACLQASGHYLRKLRF